MTTIDRQTMLPTPPPEPVRDTEPEAPHTYTDLVLVTLDASAYAAERVSLAIRRPPGNYAYALVPLAAVRALAAEGSIRGEPELWDGRPFDVAGGSVAVEQDGDQLVARGCLAHLDGARATWSDPAEDRELCRAIEAVAPRDRLAVLRLCEPDDAAPSKAAALILRALREDLGRELEPGTERRALRAVARALTLAAEQK